MIPSFQTKTQNDSEPKSVWIAAWGMLLAATGIPLSLLWDYSWESTIGIDRVWAAPHAANYFVIAFAAVCALLCARSDESGIRLGKWQAPLGVWVVLWGVFAFLAAFLFDRWWQASYGLVAG